MKKDANFIKIEGYYPFEDTSGASADTNHTSVRANLIIVRPNAIKVRSNLNRIRTNLYNIRSNDSNIRSNSNNIRTNTNSVRTNLDMVRPYNYSAEISRDNFSYNEGDGDITGDRGGGDFFVGCYLTPLPPSP